MRIHSNTLSAEHLQAAIVRVKDNAPAIYLAEYPSTYGSRSHARAFEARLRGMGARHTRRPNSGSYGADDGYAASYDDWGFWLAELFRMDPDAKAGPYNGKEDFHRQTSGAYLNDDELCARCVDSCVYACERRCVRQPVIR